MTPAECTRGLPVFWQKSAGWGDVVNVPAVITAADPARKRVAILAPVIFGLRRGKDYRLRRVSPEKLKARDYFDPVDDVFRSGVNR